MLECVRLLSVFCEQCITWTQGSQVKLRTAYNVGVCSRARAVWDFSTGGYRSIVWTCNVCYGTSRARTADGDRCRQGGVKWSKLLREQTGIMRDAGQRSYGDRQA